MTVMPGLTAALADIDLQRLQPLSLQRLLAAGLQGLAEVGCVKARDRAAHVDSHGERVSRVPQSGPVTAARLAANLVAA